MLDISWPISEEMTAYKDKKAVTFIPTKNYAEHAARESIITLGAHSGTHIDAPSHFIERGKTVDQISLNQLQGACIALDFTAVAEKISRADLEKCNLTAQIKAGDIVLLKTKNSSLSPTTQFDPHFVYLERSGAEFLAQKKVKAVGIDYLGIERNQPGHETHLTLFRNDIVIIEGLRLAHVKAGRYQCMCLPLAIQSLEGAPARAILYD